VTAPPQAMSDPGLRVSGLEEAHAGEYVHPRSDWALQASGNSASRSILMWASSVSPAGTLGSWMAGTADGMTMVTLAEPTTPKPLAAPRLESQLERDRRWFTSMKPSLLVYYHGMFVAVRGQGVVTAHADERKMFDLFYAEHGDVPAYFAYVGDRPPVPLG